MPRYFISYAHDGHAHGFGWVGLDLDEPILGGEDVETASQMIERAKPHLGQVSVISWQRFEDPA